jgi:hypothetical protein
MQFAFAAVCGLLYRKDGEGRAKGRKKDAVSIKLHQSRKNLRSVIGTEKDCSPKRSITQKSRN